MLYRYYLTQRGVSPGCQPKDFVSFEDIIGGELTDGKRCYGYVDYSRKLSDDEISAYELVPHSEAVHLIP